MKDVPENKARRRRSTRESFPSPLNQIALRHVDTVQSLDQNAREILAATLLKVGMIHIRACLTALKASRNTINTDTDLIALINHSESPNEISSQKNGVDVLNETRGIEEVDTDYLARLLIECYPSMPQTTADALVRSEVMTPCLSVVSTARLALQHAKSDFVITALYTLFEEKLDEIEQVIAKNPAFVKAVQLSRPDWKPY
jgi:hypothetical protein